MKKLFYFIIAMVLVACHNQPKMFDDYEIQAVYFPFQYPVRTLSLGNDRLDNSLDKEHKFHIGISIGGLYMVNSKNWTVNYEVDPGLVDDNLINAKGDKLQVLPPEYYTLNPATTVTIPKGEFSGLIQVQLTDAFFRDPKALLGNYVIPLRIVSSPNDVEILRGVALEDVENPNRHLATDWDVLPRDYTLFGVKYVNPYHGTWLRRGKMVEKDAAGTVVDTQMYRAEYVEFDEQVFLQTTSLEQATTTLNVGNDKWSIALDVSGSGDVLVSSLSNSATNVSGSGKFLENGDSWGGTPDQPTRRDAFHLKYSFTRSNGNVCEVSDTLVFRDRGIKVEEARPTVL